MTNHRNVKPENISPCPLCEEPMETPTIDTSTGKPRTTTCPKCGTQRTLTLPAHVGWKVWN